MVEEQTQERASSHQLAASRSSGQSFGKMFLVVFVAAMVGAYVGGSLLPGFSLPTTGKAAVLAPLPTPTLNPTPSTAGTLSMSDVITDGVQFRGDANAPVTVIEYSDYQCPFCQRSWSQYIAPGTPLNGLIDSGGVQFGYGDFPLSFHPEAEPAALAAECAGEQGKYWEFHDGLFGNQQSLGASFYESLASEVGLGLDQFKQCVSEGKYLDEIRAEFALGSQSGVSGTPTFFICQTGGNCVKVVGAQPWETIKSQIDQIA